MEAAFTGPARPVANPTNAEIRISADNTFWLWVNPPAVLTDDGSRNPGYIGTGSQTMKPNYFTFTLKEGLNTILIKAQNTGRLVRQQPRWTDRLHLAGDKVVKVTDYRWLCSTEDNPTINDAWRNYSMALGGWDAAPWNGGASVAFRSAFEEHPANWIWAERNRPGQPKTVLVQDNNQGYAVSRNVESLLTTFAESHQITANI